MMRRWWTCHFHLLGVVGIAVIGLNERSPLVEDGGHDQAQREDITRRAHG